jgi:hypothetical protein
MLHDLLEVDANSLDAVICLLAVRDFLTSQVVAPEQKFLHIAKKEGCI